MPPSHLRSRLESQHQSVPGMCWRVWSSPGAIRWPVADPGCGSRTLRRPTSPKRPRLGFRRRVLRLCTLLSLVPSSLDLNPLDYFVWVIRREHHQHDLPQYQSHAWSPPYIYIYIYIYKWAFEPWQMLSLWSRVDLRIMAIRMYITSPKALGQELITIRYSLVSCSGTCIRTGELTVLYSLNQQDLPHIYIYIYIYI